MKRCEMCNEAKAKYKCPRCLLQTCSLPCVKHHKATRECDGERDKTAYVKVKQFTDINLLSDYRFLEDGSRKTSNASRDDLKRMHNKPNFMKELEKQARHRHIDLRLMPYPMSRRKENNTTYHFKSKSILWQIQWKFPQANAEYIDKRIPESEKLTDVLKKYLDPVKSDPVARHKLSKYHRQGADNWKLFLKVDNISCKQPRFHILDPDQSITENLRGKCLIEYPSIDVVLREHWQEYPILEDETTCTEVVEVGDDQTNITEIQNTSTEPLPNNEGAPMISVREND